MARMVWYAASVFCTVSFMWFSIVPLLFMVLPRYLYVCTYSSVFFPRYRGGFSFILPIFSILLFAIPNSMWYLFATWYVMLSISWRSLWLSVISATSSIHRRHPIYSSVLCSFGPTFFLIISLFISSIIRAY